jgi:hypothetical protein
METKEGKSSSSFRDSKDFMKQNALFIIITITFTGIYGACCDSSTILNMSDTFVSEFI